MFTPLARIFAGVIVIAFAVANRPASAQHYYAYVAAESEDEVSLVHFDGSNISVVQTIPVGIWPAEIEGPHGLTVSPDGRFWFVSIAHGNPYGSVYRYRTGTNERAGSATLGLFPASMHISRATGLLYVVNFNLHGDMDPSTVSVVDPASMTELARTTTGIMPHGSRFSGDGLKHYSVSMMDGLLHELDAVTFEVSRSLHLDDALGLENEHREHAEGGEAATAGMTMTPSRVKPTWAMPAPDGRHVYVAANGAGRVVEISLESWSIERVFETAAGPYNIDVSPDGRYMVVTYKGADSTGIWDLESGRETARVSNTKSVPHGVTVTPDSRYAFVTAEGVGSEPGAVDVIELPSGRRVASTDVGSQAGGIAFWQVVHAPLDLSGR